MKNLRLLGVALFSAAVMYSCTPGEVAAPSDDVSSEVLSALTNAGFDIHNQAPINFEDGYLVEGDIYIPRADIQSLKEGNRLAVEEQYSTTNLVSAGGGRVITIYASEATSTTSSSSAGAAKGGKPGGGGGKPSGGGGEYSPAMIAGLDEAIARYNSQNLNISFQRITTNTADITMTRLNKRDERQGILGSAGFPTASGDPYGEIKMSGVLESSYGLTTAGIATIIAHEMGHCIGFRHTDYFDRSISCGGGASNEGDGGIGANHIPGTSTGADTSGNGSWMLACTNGSSRPFTNQDKTALDYLY